MTSPAGRAAAAAAAVEWRDAGNFGGTHFLSFYRGNELPSLELSKVQRITEERVA